MKSFIKISFYILFTQCVQSFAQTKDTILITADNLKVSNLKTGKTRYLVYIKNNKDAPNTEMQIWNIDIEKTMYAGKEAFVVNQKWDFKDSIVHSASSVCNVNGFKPLFHESWWKSRGKQTFDVVAKQLQINGHEITKTDSVKKNKSIYNSFETSFDQYYLNWHLDMEVFTMLPYKHNVTFKIPFYEFGYSKPEGIYYSVAGEADLVTYDNRKIKCWLLKHEEKGNLETYWISKETNEVLKLEQVINEKMYRYKVKLPFD